MNVAYVAPLRLAWARMTRMLFLPFQIENWLVLGFAAFLSQYLAGSQGGQYSWKGRSDNIPHSVIHSVRSFVLNPFWSALLIWIAIFGLVIAVVLIWINARGRFIFLHNVAHERPGIVEPWQRYARLGNSLFLWSLLYAFVTLAIVVALALPFIGALITAFQSEEFRWPAVGLMLAWAPVAAAVGIVVAYFYMMLNHFVVPIMFRHDLTTAAAWGRFIPLFRAHPGNFLLYGLFMLGLTIVVGFACATLGFATCCIGFVLLALPYIGSVITLPVEVTMRALGPEFLAQFGAEWSVLAAPPAKPAPVEGAGA
jgi:hypothetical protein